MANRFLKTHAPRTGGSQNSAQRIRFVRPIDPSSRLRFTKLPAKDTPRPLANSSST